jgi:hypothetical protein
MSSNAVTLPERLVSVVLKLLAYVVRVDTLDCRDDTLLDMFAMLPVRLVMLPFMVVMLPFMLAILVFNVDKLAVTDDCRLSMLALVSPTAPSIMSRMPTKSSVMLMFV